MLDGGGGDVACQTLTEVLAAIVQEPFYSEVWACAGVRGGDACVVTSWVRVLFGEVRGTAVSCAPSSKRDTLSTAARRWCKHTAHCFTSPASRRTWHPRTCWSVMRPFWPGTAMDAWRWPRRAPKAS